VSNEIADTVVPVVIPIDRSKPPINSILFVTKTGTGVLRSGAGPGPRPEVVPVGVGPVWRSAVCVGFLQFIRG
jgi:hypothetical protein